MQNQKEQARLLGVRVSPWPLFLAAWYPTNTPITDKLKPVKIERYFLGWHRHLYDTLGLYHGLAALDDTDEVSLLPVGGRALGPAGAKPAERLTAVPPLEVEEPAREEPFVPGTYRDISSLFSDAG
jgi:hypothetical protein